VSQEWYYSIDGDRQGPVAGAELKKLAEAGKLKSSDLVWKDGMADWVPAKSIKGLFGGAAAAAPSASRSGEQAAAKSRPVADEDDERPARARRRDEDEGDRPRRRRDEEDEEDDRPARSRRREEDDEEEDRPVRRREEDDEDELEEDRPRKKRRRVPEDTANKKMVAGLLAILIGSLGIHKFYLGMNTAGIIMLLVSLVGCVVGGSVVMGIIALVEGILYLTKSDEDFYQTYIVDQKQWF
jgi:TM2 domain-containing membrane protein YozV